VPEEYYRHLRGELTREELYAAFPAEARRADQEAWRAELGTDDTPPDQVRRRSAQVAGLHGRCPCGN